MVAEHPANAVLRNDDPDGADMSWALLAREVAGASDAPLPLLNVAALRLAIVASDNAQVSAGWKGHVRCAGKLL